jgi:hypothetical protein
MDKPLNTRGGLNRCRDICCDGRGRWADFLIEAKGKSWYWEHCGRLDDESYRNRWERKLKLYAGNGYSMYSIQNPEGRLIVTEDGPE